MTARLRSFSAGCSFKIRRRRFGETALWAVIYPSMKNCRRAGPRFLKKPAFPCDKFPQMGLRLFKIEAMQKIREKDGRLLTRRPGSEDIVGLLDQLFQRV
ncbi:hypothetical protein SDC9_105985 [bioreactor metagenome]|uniref:Uncharacterized protein n=1 Tax=bioreactor metagenome TaxID=1076179 RepID=A0A645B156_9ZZZZ